MKNYLYAQKKKIEIDKWCEGVRLRQDPGQNYIMNWIMSNASWFRNAWDRSLCQTCGKSIECGHQVTNSCHKYQPIEDD